MVARQGSGCTGVSRDYVEWAPLVCDANRPRRVSGKRRACSEGLMAAVEYARGFVLRDASSNRIISNRHN